MKLQTPAALCLLLILAASFAGCTSPAWMNDDTQVTATPTQPPSLVTYENHGVGFTYMDNLVKKEVDISEINSAGWESGQINLRGEFENSTISWMGMKHRPPDIPAVYESIRESSQKDPEMSDVKLSLLQTYPATTCGQATMIGHVSFYDNVHKEHLNEGILFWYHPKQDRTYVINVVSDRDYTSFIRPALDTYQQSFRCIES